LNSINIPTSPSVFWWQPAAWLRASGPDAASFLQGQFTNDLRGLAPGGSVYGLWLNVKAKVVADSFVLRGEGAEEFWIGSYFSTAGTIRERLESFIIADDVTIEDQTDAWRGISWMGGAPPAEFGARVRCPGRRAQAQTIEWVFPAHDSAEVRDLCRDARELSAGEMERLRIEAGIPAVPRDLGLGDLPNEGGLEAEAISYTKGCYLGQEVIARLRSMGQVRRRLLRVTGDGENFPALPVPIFSAGRRVGELRSAALDGAGGFIGLAMLSLLHLTPGAKLSFSPETEPVLRVIDKL
jgi:tRNA-modifying protein YgfZ